MIGRFLMHWILNTLSLWIVSQFLSGMVFTSWGALFMAGLVLGIVNTLVRPVVSFLALPLTILTLGLFRLVINALMLVLVAVLVPGFLIHSFLTAFIAAILMSILSFFISRLAR